MRLSVILALLTLLVGCGTVDPTAELRRELDYAGYQVQNLALSANTLTVAVDRKTGQATPQDQLDVAQLVWRKYRGRFGTLTLTVAGHQASVTSGQLEMELGKRDADLESRPAARWSIPLVVGAALLVGLLLYLRLPRRRAPGGGRHPSVQLQNPPAS
ncbi:hypothetical protein D5S17_00120 [Pseudonocardiaceae bacterium YIM PH 21723]|nr:hypothetical protein D5S17_00120 [Pseudonocardiaceae bacterium YIM PH 21723]